MSNGQATAEAAHGLDRYLAVMTDAHAAALELCATEGERALVHQRMLSLQYRTALRDEREPPGEMLERALSALRRTQGRRCAGIALPGYPALEDALYGMRGVTLLTGPTGAGKTALTLGLALSVAAGRQLAQQYGNRCHDAPTLPDAERAAVVYVTCEMEPQVLVHRMLSMLSGVGMREMMTRLDEDAQHWQDAVMLLESLMGDGWLRIVTPENVGWEWSRGGHALAGLAHEVDAAAGGRRAMVVLDSIATLDTHVMPVRRDDGTQQQYRSELDKDADIAHGLRCWRGQLMESGSALLAVHEESKARTGTGDTHAARGSSRYAYSADALLAMMHADGEGGTTHPIGKGDGNLRTASGLTVLGDDADGSEVDMLVNKARDGGKASTTVMMLHMWGKGWVTEHARKGIDGPAALLGRRERRKLERELREQQGGARK